MSNVPNVPGVPPLLTGTVPQALFGLLTSNLVAIPTNFSLPQWGIFQNGIPVVLADNVVSFDYRQASTISTYPLQKGAFESYDKVATPFEAIVRFSAGGSEENRRSFLDSIDAIAGTLTLYDVATPEVVYTSVNVASYDYRRTSTDGAGLIQVDVRLTEIRVTATTTFSNTKSPAAANPISSGNVATGAATSAQGAQMLGVQ
jgi:hypothetical protein